MGEPAPCRVAIVGAGNIAREHARAFADVPGVTIAGIYSRTRARAEALARECGARAVFSSIAELYEKTEAHLVVVAVSLADTAAVGRECFDFPWYILLEKPPALTVPVAEELCAAARARSRTVLVALNRRFLSSTRAALDDLARDTRPRFIMVQDQEDLVQAAALGHPGVVLDHWMYANAIHLIDYFCLFGRGEIEGVEPVLSWNSSKPGVVVAKVTFTSDDVGVYQAIWNGPGPWAAAIVTPGTRWEMRPLEEAAVQRAGKRRLEPVAPGEWDRRFKPGFRLQAETAVNHALGGRTDFPTLDDAMKTMRLVEAIYSDRPQ